MIRADTQSDTYDTFSVSDCCCEIDTEKEHWKKTFVGTASPQIPTGVNLKVFTNDAKWDLNLWPLFRGYKHEKWCFDAFLRFEPMTFSLFQLRNTWCSDA